MRDGNCFLPGRPALDAIFTQAILDASVQYGLDMFKIHPKGTGIICTAPDGIAPHQFISEYLGDIYPPYRWCERLDVVEQAQEKYTEAYFTRFLQHSVREATGPQGLRPVVRRRVPKKQHGQQL